MQPIDDVRAISRIAYGFIASKALFSALEIDLFGHLEGPERTIAGLSEASGVAAMSPSGTTPLPPCHLIVILD